MFSRKLFPRLALIAVLAGTAAFASGADARPRDRDQDRVYQATKRGHMLPLRIIEQRVVPRMGDAEYLGPEVDAAAGVYRLKFLREGRMIWVDVDARSGNILGRSGR